ncbi:transcription factor AP-4 [Exaiptasia diaphana]|uniref:BHLH domain-containing protein n=1 Tax=Exaiptasia diaphana TaxID=2652724 RepID=A0A913Y6W9_EXADI|nr:transcription factor AP-4 [Exaiptasia diaphana]KXJ22441.1 Transcription factor AP-4 [Exaiptasia diaphana]
MTEECRSKLDSLDESFLDDTASDVDCSSSPESDRDRERRLRREIANSNERRRMQSINSGFQALRTLIPNADGEKLSKAAILQQTAEYIFSLEQDKTKLLQQNTTLKRILSHCGQNEAIKADENEIPCKRHRTENDGHAKARGSNQTDPKDKDENDNNISQDDLMEDLQKELIDLRCQLEKERRLRISLEGQKQKLESEFNELKAKCQGKYTANKALATTRQNLDTIVQAIKHLEGDCPDSEETPIKFKADVLSKNTDLTSRRLIV